VEVTLVSDSQNSFFRYILNSLMSLRFLFPWLHSKKEDD
jgi:hypothetical protein